MPGLARAGRDSSKISKRFPGSLMSCIHSEPLLGLVMQKTLGSKPQACPCWRNLNWVEVTASWCCLELASVILGGPKWGNISELQCQERRISPWKASPGLPAYACRCFPNLSWKSGWPSAPTSPRSLSPTSICVFVQFLWVTFRCPGLGASSPTAGSTCFSSESGRSLRSLIPRSRKTLSTTIVHQGEMQILTKVGIAESWAPALISFLMVKIISKNN